MTTVERGRCIVCRRPIYETFTGWKHEGVAPVADGPLDPFDAPPHGVLVDWSTVSPERLLDRQRLHALEWAMVRWPERLDVAEAFADRVRAALRAGTIGLGTSYEELAKQPHWVQVP